jgi:2,3-bisphosphoglycerate-dependent phosphoglycerate mutase
MEITCCAWQKRKSKNQVYGFAMSETIPSYHLTFLRHGESVGNAENRFQGHADFPLTEKGRAQAQDLAERWLADDVTFDRCISSPLLRTRQTAEIVTQALNVPLEFDADWMEINNGLMAGLNDEEAEKVAPPPNFMTPYTRYGKTGESRWELYLRAGKAIQAILDRAPARYLVVAHGGILNMAMYAILNISPQTDFSGPRFMFNNTTFASFRYEPEHHNWRLLQFSGYATND